VAAVSNAAIWDEVPFSAPGGGIGISAMVIQVCGGDGNGGPEDEEA